MKKTNKMKMGFTLTELIVVIVIIGILAAILIPSLTTYVKRARIAKDQEVAATASRTLFNYLIEQGKDIKKMSVEEIYHAVIESSNGLYATFSNGKYSFVECESARYGYNFWFNTSSGVIELVGPKSDTLPLSVTDGGMIYSGLESFAWTAGFPYLLLSTNGSKLAETVQNAKYASSEEEVIALLEEINSNTDGFVEMLADLLETTTFVFSDGSIYEPNTEEEKNIYFAMGIKVAKDENGNDVFELYTASTIKQPLTGEYGDIILPASIVLIPAGTFYDVNAVSIVLLVNNNVNAGDLSTIFSYNSIKPGTDIVTNNNGNTQNYNVEDNGGILEIINTENNNDNALMAMTKDDADKVAACQNLLSEKLTDLGSITCENVLTKRSDINEIVQLYNNLDEWIRKLLELNADVCVNDNDTIINVNYYIDLHRDGSIEKYSDSILSEELLLIDTAYEEVNKLRDYLMSINNNVNYVSVGVLEFEKLSVEELFSFSGYTPDNGFNINDLVELVVNSGTSAIELSNEKWSVYPLSPGSTEFAIGIIGDLESQIMIVSVNVIGMESFTVNNSMQQTDIAEEVYSNKYTSYEAFPVQMQFSYVPYDMNQFSPEVTTEGRQIIENMISNITITLDNANLSIDENYSINDDFYDIKVSGEYVYCLYVKFIKVIYSGSNEEYSKITVKYVNNESSINVGIKYNTNGRNVYKADSFSGKVLASYDAYMAADIIFTSEVVSGIGSNANKTTVLWQEEGGFYNGKLVSYRSVTGTTATSGVDYQFNVNKTVYGNNYTFDASNYQLKATSSSNEPSLFYLTGVINNWNIKMVKVSSYVYGVNKQIYTNCATIRTANANWKILNSTIEGGMRGIRAVLPDTTDTIYPIIENTCISGATANLEVYSSSTNSKKIELKNVHFNTTNDKMSSAIGANDGFGTPIALFPGSGKIENFSGTQIKLDNVYFYPWVNEAAIRRGFDTAIQIASAAGFTVTYNSSTLNSYLNSAGYTVTGNPNKVYNIGISYLSATLGSTINPFVTDSELFSSYDTGVKVLIFFNATVSNIYPKYNESNPEKFLEYYNQTSNITNFYSAASSGYK